MSQADDNVKKLELLKKARQLLNQEYVARRAEQHRLWIENSEKSWRTNGALLPYPAGAMYPTEDEIVAKALELYNLSNGTVVPKPVPLPIQTDQPPSVTAQLEEAYYGSAPETTPVIPPEPVMDPYVEPYIKPVAIPEEIIPEPELVATTPIEPEVIEPEVVVPEVIEPEVIPTTINAAAAKEDKHTLLRSVLSSWLQKK